MDEDLDAMARDQLVEEAKKLRNAIREHRDSSGHDLCWHHPRLWGLLPDKTDPLPVVPAWPEFIKGCIRYRQSLDEQAPHQPRSIQPYEGQADAPTENTVASILWRRLDSPGHDACRLVRMGTDWHLIGTAVFRHRDVPARMHYRVVCDSAWQLRQGVVSGWVGPSAIDFTVMRTPDHGWLLNSVPVPGLQECLDLDLNFTPATNLVHIRRLAMAEGDEVKCPAALLRLPEGVIGKLDQSYRRQGPSDYWYVAAGDGYAGILAVDAAGFVTKYPGLWEAETRSERSA